MVLRAIKGIEVNEETKAMDLIKEVGSKGYYLGKKHTLANMYKELYLVQLTDRNTREDWMSQGAKGLEEVAKEKVIEILREHVPEPLSESVLKEMELYVKEVEQRQGKV